MTDAPPNTAPTAAADELITAPAPPKPLDLAKLEAGDPVELARLGQMSAAIALTDSQRLAAIAAGRRIDNGGVEATANGQLTNRDTEFAVKTILDAMSAALAKGHRIEIRGFGSFGLNYRPPRTGRNPKSGEKVQVPEKYVPHFKAGKELRERVDGEDGTEEREPQREPQRQASG